MAKETIEYDGKTFRLRDDFVEKRGAHVLKFEEVREEPDGVDDAQLDALDETIEKWERIAAGKAEWANTYSDCPMCRVNLRKPSHIFPDCNTCLLYKHLEPVGKICIDHPGLVKLLKNKDDREGAAEFLAALKALRDELRPGKKVDEVEALVADFKARFNLDPYTSRAIVEYVLANYTLKAEAQKKVDEQYNAGCKNGRDYERSKAAAGKPHISPENLDKLAQGYRWREAYRNRVLAMLNAEVAAPDKRWRDKDIDAAFKRGRELERDLATPQVDFVVSGEDGERLTAMTDRARQQWKNTCERWWVRYSCEKRCEVLVDIYSYGNRIFLDREAESDEKRKTSW